MRARNDQGDPVLPEVWDEVALKDYERKNPFDFASQMMNEPGEGEHMPITREQVEQLWVSEAEVPHNMTYSVHCDIAWKSLETLGTGDFNVIQLWGHTRGDVYYLWGARSNTWRSEDFLDALVACVQRCRKERLRAPFTITIDKPTGGSGDAIANLIWNAFAQAQIVCPPVLQITRTAKKESRIRAAAGYWINGNVRLVRDAPEVEALVLEMVRLGVTQFDDMADAAADVFHADVYTPERVYGTDPQPPVPRRPYDEILQMPLELVDDEGVRELYDRIVEREAAREERWIH